MKTVAILATALLAQLPAVAHAQHANYAGQQTRDIKALSPQEVKQYLTGAGMGYARAAELNRYPGPMHVLELADRLALTPEQRGATEKLMAAHKDEARAIGAKLVEAERALDQLFAKTAADETALADQVRKVAAIQGDFRLSHLETHRRMRALLSEEQINRYVQLRGYGGTPAATPFPN
jgi:Spy/CpxP family protein refolding chaperone